ncbi:hypothetical protein MAR_004213 [Mya arenaria]|uniref:Uncharacterized protein n=1 Tax=Mya arenaria TaxID=6604 RepID=A0ABY7F037_MYAAR|nr:hypothetical protein MAR_004213 [Mya arenaria]
MAGGFSESKVVKEEVMERISTAYFDSKLHPVVHRMQRRDGSYICEDIFKVFVKQGEDVIPGQSTTSFEFNPSQSAGVNQTIEVYKSEQENPLMLVTECQKVGLVRLTLPTGDTTALRVTVNMQFGGTQMKVTAGIKASSDYKPVEASFEWL